MVYDVINGLNYMLQFVRPEQYQASAYAFEEGSEYTDNYRSGEGEAEYADNYRSGEGEEPTYGETAEEEPTYGELAEEEQQEEESRGFSLF